MVYLMILDLSKNPYIQLEFCPFYSFIQIPLFGSFLFSQHLSHLSIHFLWFKTLLSYHMAPKTFHIFFQHNCNLVDYVLIKVNTSTFSLFNRFNCAMRNATFQLYATKTCLTWFPISATKILSTLALASTFSIFLLCHLQMP